MIAEKLERNLDNLERLAARGNGDLEALLPDLTAAMRAEVDRVRAFEAAAVLPEEAAREGGLRKVEASKNRAFCEPKPDPAQDAPGGRHGQEKTHA